MNIILSGGTGFLGSYLAKEFVKKGYNLTIIKRSFSKTDRISDILDQVNTFDIDMLPLSQLFDSNRLDIVVHASTDYGRNSALSEVLNANVIFPLKLLENLANHNGTAFINTDSFFNNPGATNYSYLNSYTLSKRYFNELAHQIVTQSKTKFINMKLEHLYGPSDSETKFTMDIIRRLLNNELQIDLTPGQQKRDFIYVSDAVDAYIKVIENVYLFSPQTLSFEVGQGKTYTIRDYVSLAKNICESSSTLNFGALAYRENEIMRSVANNLTLRNLNWMPLIDLEEGIKLIVTSLID